MARLREEDERVNISMECDAATTPWTIGSLLIPIGRFKRVGVVPTRHDNIGIFPAFFCMPMCTRVHIRHPNLDKIKIINFFNSVFITVGNFLGQ